MSFLPSYPNSPPSISIRALGHVPHQSIADLTNKLNAAAADLAGQEMIYELALIAQDFLADLPHDPPDASSYDRMLARIQSDEQRKLASEQLEQDRIKRMQDESFRQNQSILAQQILQERQHKDSLVEIDRASRRMKLPSVDQLIRSPNSSPNSSEATPIAPPQPSFLSPVTPTNPSQPKAFISSPDRHPKPPVQPPKQQNQPQPKQIQTKQSNQIQTKQPPRFKLQNVTAKSLLFKRNRTCIYAAHFSNQNSNSPSTNQGSPIIRTKSFRIHQRHAPHLNQLNSALSNASRINVDGIVPLFDFSIDQSKSGQAFAVSIQLLIGLCYGPSLLDTIRSAGPIELQKVRSHAIAILNIVSAIHALGAIHQGITSKTVFFDSDGHIRLAGHISEYQLVKLANLEEPIAVSNRSSAWECPDLVSGTPSKKTDVWMISIVILEMLLGEPVSTNSITRILASKSKLPVALGSLISRMMTQDPDNRPSIQDILQHPFFSSESPSLSPFSPPFTPSDADLQLQIVPKTPARDRATSSIFDGDRDLQRQSRYYADFEELEFLGRGGFGQVVKARNLLDGAIYAIKRVRINPKDKERSDRLLREVQTLSRLNNDHVVRYYQAWIEHVSDAHEIESALSFETIDESDGFSNISSDEDDDDTHSLAIHFREDWLDSQEPSISFVDQSRHPSSDASVTTSDAGDSVPAGRRSRTSKRLILLYIQMEYCEKQTLRDIIDSGLDDSEAWRLFRQLLEGLGHIHAQGIIHRDLKPSNVFMDAHQNVKIGDFGLATARRDATIYHNKPALISEDMYLLDDSSMTSDVGTPVYVAPEILLKSGRYNTKVDMYSLGIVFFEMVYFFSTGMQRAHVLRDIRQSAVVFPQDFNHARLSSQEEIIRKLLSHTPKERPSCAQLLQSPLVPTRVDEEYINEELLRIIRQNNPVYFSRLMMSLLGQRVDKHKDLVYDYQRAPSVLDVHNAAITSHVERHAVNVFVRHGAVPAPVPLLLPKTNELAEIYANRHPAEMIDAGGNVVQLRYDLVAPFARVIASMSQLPPLPLKRYNIERVFRHSVAMGQPRSVMESDFDIVYTRSSHMLAEAEVIKTACEVLGMETIGLDSRAVSELHIRVNHVDVLMSVLNHCGVPLDKHRSMRDVLEQLGYPITLNQLKSHLTELGLSKLTLERLFAFADGLEMGTGKSILSGVDQDIVFQSAYNRVETLYGNLHALGIRHRIFFEPLLVFSSTIYTSGILFQIGYRRPKRFDMVAAGGNYDKLLHVFRGPFSCSMNDVCCFGVSIALSKIVTGISNTTENTMSRHAMDESRHGSGVSRADVLVASFAKSGANMHENLSIASDLWTSGISADLAYDNYVASQDDIQRAWKDGYRAIVILKQRGQDASSGSLIKIRGLSSRHEVEVARSDVVSTLQHELNMSFGPRSSTSQQVVVETVKPTPSASSSTKTTCIVTQTPKKSKSKARERSGMEGRAMNAVSRAGAHAHVLAVELTQAEISRLRHVWFASDDTFKRLLQDSGMTHAKDYVQQVRRHLQKLYRDAKDSRQGDQASFVWMVSDPDGTALPISFQDQSMKE